MPSAWTNVAKPSETSVVSIGGGGGEPIGLLLALTYAGFATSSVITGWTDIAKPVGTASWVSIAKPTSSVWTAVAKPTT